MYSQPLESDWKVYRKRVAEWRDRYLSRKNVEILAILTDEARMPTAQFWDTYEKMEKEARLLDDSLGRFARSQMMTNLMVMYQRGIVEDADLEEFSEELREQIMFVAKGLGG